MPDRKQPSESAGAAGKAAAPGEAASAAETATERAKRAGANGPGGTAAQRMLRDSAILAHDFAGTPQKDIGEMFGVSTRTVRAVIKRARSAPSVLDRPPMQVVEDLTRAYRQAIASFDCLAFANTDRNPGVALGAMRASIETHEKLIALLAQLGHLPRDLALFRQEVEMRRVGELMVQKLGELEDGLVTATEVRQYFERLLTDALWEEEPEP